MVLLVCMIFNNLIQSNFSIFFLLYNISHFHSVPFFFLFSFVFIAIHPIRIFLWEVQLINITIFVLWYSIGMQYFYGIHLIGILPNCEFLLVLEMNCLWVSWFANISLHSRLPSSFLKVFFLGTPALKLKYVAFSWFWFHCSRGWIPKEVIRTQKDLVVYILCVLPMFSLRFS